MASSTKESSLQSDNISNWLHAFVVVNFDIDFGQVIETVYPKNVSLTEAEKTIINYASFPDSHSSFLGDSFFSYRMRCTSFMENIRKSSKTCSAYPSHLKPTDGFCFAYVLFRQVKDTSLRRNYFQKSVVILTSLPFDALFFRILSIIAPKYFIEGEKSFLDFSQWIAKWPKPTPGHNHELNLFKMHLTISIPSSLLQSHVNRSASRKSHAHEEAQEENVKNDSSSNSKTSSNGLWLDPNQLVAQEPERMDRMDESECDDFIQYDIETRAYEPNYYEAFKIIISQLQRLWEIVLTAQPILVIGSSPSMCSLTVKCLVSCISPLVYSGDFRPFFTIHDPDYKEMTQMSSVASLPIILGVTNPFFSKVIGHWPNIVRLESNNITSRSSKNINNALLKNLILEDSSQPGLYSKKKPFLKKCPTIKCLKEEFAKCVMNSSNAWLLSMKIRMLFRELTHNFMIPLERYVSSLMPLQKTISPFLPVPQLASFNIDDFIQTLSSSAFRRTKMVSGNWIDLYKNFLATPHFATWFSERQAEVANQLKMLHLQAVCDADIGRWLKLRERSETELVDLIILMNSQLDRSVDLSSQQREGLDTRIGLLLQNIQPDLRHIIESSLSGTGSTFSTKI